MAAIEEQVVDFISVGSGVGGLAGATAAAELGLETVLLEKDAELGGMSVDSYGILFIPNNHLQEALGVDDSFEDAKQYLSWMGAGLASPEHLESYVQEAPIALKYFAEVHKIPFYIVENLSDHHYPKAPGSRSFGRLVQTRPISTARLAGFQNLLAHSPYIERVTFEEMSQWGGRYAQDLWDKRVLAEREAQDVRTFGAALVGHFLEAALRSKVRILNRTPLERLVVEDGVVRGVLSTRDGKRIMLRARKGVLLATGGSGGNQYVSRWLGDGLAPKPGGTGVGSWTSDGLGSALDVGAALTVRTSVAQAGLSFTPPETNPEGQWYMMLRDFGAPHSLIVNQDGQRFANESDFQQYGRELRVFDTERHRYKNDPCFFVFDQTYLEEVGLGTIPRGSQAPEWLIRADTVTDLAMKLGIAPDGLEETVNRFNRFSERNADSDFHRGEISFYQTVAAGTQQRAQNPQLGKLDRSPFYGIQLKTTTGAAAGLVTNTSGQVLHWSGEAIPGLYATGTLAADLGLGVGYNCGYNLTEAMTYGLLAAKHAAR